MLLSHSLVRCSVLKHYTQHCPQGNNYLSVFCVDGVFHGVSIKINGVSITIPLYQRRRIVYLSEILSHPIISKKKNRSLINNIKEQTIVMMLPFLRGCQLPWFQTGFRNIYAIPG